MMLLQSRVGCVLHSSIAGLKDSSDRVCVSLSQHTHIGLYSKEVCSVFAGKWFVSTGKDNLLNAWRTPYGASIFQVTG